jgi:hypothetical protein
MCSAALHGSIYRVIIFSDQYRLSLPANTAMHVWAGHSAGIVHMISGPTQSDKQYQSEKIMTL